MSDDAARICHWCEQPEDFPTKPESELRPYGPGGALVCYTCATSPEHEEETHRNFGTLLDASSAAGGGVAVLTDHGPEPFHPDDFDLPSPGE